MLHYNKIFGLILTTILVVISLFGCKKKLPPGEEAIIRYQKIEIPMYCKSDYEELINSDNDEVKYNAICNLTPNAQEYAKIIEKGPADESSKGSTSCISEYDNAKNIFAAISRELNSKNSSIQAASLIFTTEFSSEYKNKEELIKLVMGIKPRDIRTQYEQIYALIELSDSNTFIESNLIENFIKSRSWLIRSMTYQLLSKIKNNNYHERLIEEYAETNNIYDKLLIIHSFNSGYSAEVFELIINEILTTENDKIKNQIVKILKKHEDKQAVINWIINAYTNIDKKLLSAIIEEYYSEITCPTGNIFFYELLSSNQEDLIGLVDQEKFFTSLFDGIENENTQKDIVNLEKAVQRNRNLNQAWTSYANDRREKKLRQNKKDELEAIILPKYNTLLEKHLEESIKLFTDAGMEKGEIEETIKSIKEFLQLFKESVR